MLTQAVVANLLDQAVVATQEQIDAPPKAGENTVVLTQAVVANLLDQAVVATQEQIDVPPKAGDNTVHGVVRDPHDVQHKRKSQSTKT